jgi:hypothetical protein
MNWWARYSVTLTTDGESKVFYFTNLTDVKWALRMATLLDETRTKATARDRWRRRIIRA